jgi:negative elongation factor C/D
MRAGGLRCIVACELALVLLLVLFVFLNGMTECIDLYFCLLLLCAGYAQMASLLCGWLKFAVEQQQQQQHHHQQQQKAAATATPDESSFLHSLVAERFDPGRFAGIFSAGGAGAPRWLASLIADEDGRKLVYSLSARHKNCLLLGFAIQKILLQPGREAEVAAVGASLVSHFGVFHRLLAAKLRELAAADSEETLLQIGRELAGMAAQSQHAYAYTQQLLAALEMAAAPAGGRFRRAAQEVEAAAAAAHGPTVTRMKSWLVGPDAGDAAILASAAVVGLIAAAEELGPGARASSAATAPSDVVKLHQLYFHPPIAAAGAAAAPSGDGDGSKDRPPLGLLRDRRLLDLLIAGVFDPIRNLQPDELRAHAELLAAATATSPEDWDALGPAAPTLAPAAAAIQQAEGLLRRSLGEAGQVPLTPDELRLAGDLLDLPCCTLGLLCALRSRLTKPEHWAAASGRSKTPGYPHLLREAGRRQPRLHGDMLSLLSGALRALGSSNHEMSKALLEVTASLAASGATDQVLAWADDWGGRADPPLARHFALCLLEIAAPPYSVAFVSGVLKLMLHAGVKRHRLTSRDRGAKALLDEFAAACAEAEIGPQLPAKEAQLLAELIAGAGQGDAMAVGSSGRG